jgi:carotenoid cleavage dioxygenase
MLLRYRPPADEHCSAAGGISVSIQSEPATSTWLTGLYEPVTDELDVTDLEVRGTIPDGLRGSFWRNGPNPAFAPLGGYHLFDGDGMIHAVDLADGRARYRNAWVGSAGLTAEQRAGHALFGGLAEFTMPPPEVIAEAGMMKNTANTSVIRHAGRHMALMEACPPTELTADLTTVGPVDFHDDFSGAFTAHPRLDPTTGELHAFGYSPVAPYLRYHVIDADGRLDRSLDLDLPRPVMMHDFAITDRYAVFFDLPAVFDLDALLSGGEGIRWEPDAGARIGLLPRAAVSGDAIVWHDVDPFWMFHLVNAHDAADGTIIVEGCRSSRLNTAFGGETLAEPVRPSLHRWTIDPAARAVTDAALDDGWADFPRTAEAVGSKPYRYGYLARADQWDTEEVVFRYVSRFDMATGARTEHDLGPGRAGGEAVFAADPDGAAEDDGWVLTFAHDRADGSTELLVLDAAHLDDEPVARVAMPRRVPLGFHAGWFPEAR